MKGVYPWLYVDYKDNIWKFTLNDDNELKYKIMYKEGKWTKENLIDSRVTGFGLFIDNSEIIHLVYSNTKGELRYCTMQDKQWVGIVLYEINDSNYKIENIKNEIVGTSMHIFFTLVSQTGNDHGMLMHCIWNGNNTRVTKIQDIILNTSLNEYYLININNKNEIYLFYLSDKGDEISLNYSIYKNNAWLKPSRLYGIQGEDISFDVEMDRKNIHILNKSKENSSYSLDHVVIDAKGSIKYFAIYNGENNLVDPIIINYENEIYTIWIENNEIYYSHFTESNWKDSIKYTRNNNLKVKRYNGYINYGNEKYLEQIKLYATCELDISLYDPQNIIRLKNNDNSDIKINISKSTYKNDENKIIDSEFYKIKEENKVLEERIIYLNSLIEKKQDTLENYKQQITKALDQKRKAEENINIFLELQKNLQKENEYLNKELTLYQEKEKKYIDEIALIIKEKNKLKEELIIRDKIINENNSELEKKINIIEEEKLKREKKEKEYENEIDLLKAEINNNTKELLIKDRKIQEEIDLKIILENENRIINDENLFIRKEISELLEENKKINSELEREKNKSVMEKLLRKRT